MLAIAVLLYYKYDIDYIGPMKLNWPKIFCTKHGEPAIIAKIMFVDLSHLSGQTCLSEYCQVQECGWI